MKALRPWVEAEGLPIAKLDAVQDYLLRIGRDYAGLMAESEPEDVHARIYIYKALEGRDEEADRLITEMIKVINDDADNTLLMARARNSRVAANVVFFAALSAGVGILFVVLFVVDRRTRERA